MNQSTTTASYSSSDFLGLRITSLRKADNLTLTEAASELGIELVFYQAIEAGREAPSAELIQKIADLYGINSEWLATGNGSKAISRSAELSNAMVMNTLMAKNPIQF